MTSVKEIAALAKEQLGALGNLSTAQKNNAILKIADNLIKYESEIIAENKKDLDNALTSGMAKGMVDRLTLTPSRIADIAEGARQVAALDDPIGEVTGMKTRPNGLSIGQIRVPLGLIGIIFESRPNVTVDSAILCLKAGNAVLLRGGKEAINSNKKLVWVMQTSLLECGINPNTISFITDVSRESASEMMRLNGCLDVLIPRGSASLINACVMNSTVPVIETGTGNCHIYADEFCDFDMAIDILINAKTTRISVCNSAESLLVHKNIADTFLPLAAKALFEKNVEIRGCDRCVSIVPSIKPATEDDYYTEFLDYIISVRIVDSIDEAIAHINKYNTKHSDAIITKSYENSQKFLKQVDSASVYVNASTRFTDGFEFGLGAEIGISTQKLHARGPMGLKDLTSLKYIIYGDGQIR